MVRAVEVLRDYALYINLRLTLTSALTKLVICGDDAVSPLSSGFEREGI